MGNSSLPLRLSKYKRDNDITPDLDRDQDRARKQQGDHFTISPSGPDLHKERQAYRQIKQERSKVATSSPLLDVHQESYTERNKVG